MMKQYQVLSLLACVVPAASQGVTEKIAPEAKAPAGCGPSFDRKFEISILELGNPTKRSEQTRQCHGEGTLVSQLVDGVLTDAHGRTGYIASNFQFQFDGPPQAGAIYTAGFSVCNNGSLAFGGTTVFYQCRSGDFQNLYDRWWAEQCSPAEILVIPCGDSHQDAAINGVVVGTTVLPTTVVVPQSDGEGKAVVTTAAVPLCSVGQIGDGQIQGHPTLCSEFEFPTPLTDLVPVSEYADGQIQVTPPAPGTPGNPPNSQPTPSNSIPYIFLTTTPASGFPPAQTTIVPPGVVIASFYSKPPTVVVANDAGRRWLSSTTGYMGMVMGVIGGLLFL
ncbi:hypothetical protein SMACR_07128 [Sordaria macrospora]|uniref:WGS project CABT00000000 data, contig 2.39 n=2 Tax=Sordaria macrospora TaxID=5147 RepID=F7W7M0_SORMK|nr:uncharacterized protein SMAC_07128 [Sordaria macrospora k-hell]KAA8633445.1 hypothetical protein SMACR_07128 [Sordaria macrospora]KAH7630260.1 hypothetical protein B0T09DRAFT_145436 [Sordaria sp. MPI-SDFR-AT-0083]WPJ66929.1 hypothetical protein SMAC4_07128 [Sordaria macrospora]CCC13504.1 unnamed protein product [Sordaria macrospora k-hell]